MRRLRPLLPIVAVLCISLLQGCATPVRLAAVPKDQEAAATVAGMTGIRYWQKADLALLEEDGDESYRREAAAFAAAGNDGPLPPANYLAISGGGEDGAFGAGLLIGWTAAGTRPEFKLVTGISTGALTAPFAFLGPKYDEQLKASLHDHNRRRTCWSSAGSLAALFNDALADNAPLQQLVAKYVTADMLKAIAVENAKGRILLHRHDESRCPSAGHLEHRQDRGQRQPEGAGPRTQYPCRLGRHPGAFPPMMIDVEVNGKALPGDACRRRRQRAGLRLPAVPASPRTSRSKPVSRGSAGLSSSATRGLTRTGPTTKRQTLTICRARHLVADPEPGRRRPLPHLRDDPARRGRLQPGLHSIDVQRAAARAVRAALHE